MWRSRYGGCCICQPYWLLETAVNCGSTSLHLPHLLPKDISMACDHSNSQFSSRYHCKTRTQSLPFMCHNCPPLASTRRTTVDRLIASTSTAPVRRHGDVNLAGFDQLNFTSRKTSRARAPLFPQCEKGHSLGANISHASTSTAHSSLTLDIPSNCILHDRIFTRPGRPSTASHLHSITAATERDHRITTTFTYTTIGTQLIDSSTSLSPAQRAHPANFNHYKVQYHI